MYGGNRREDRLGGEFFWMSELYGCLNWWKNLDESVNDKFVVEVNTAGQMEITTTMTGESINIIGQESHRKCSTTMETEVVKVEDVERNRRRNINI